MPETDPEFLDIFYNFLGLISIFLGILTTHKFMRFVVKETGVGIGYPKWAVWNAIIICDIIVSPIMILVYWFGLGIAWGLFLDILSGCLDVLC